MQSLILISFCLILITSIAFSLQLQQTKILKTCVKTMNMKKVNNDFSTIKVAASLALLAPINVIADDGGQNAVIFPIAISVLTMVPFLYYQQALRPKERKVKQIELDENLREVKTKGKK